MGTLPTTATGNSPCGACKFLRRRCTSECVFAPYFSNEHEPARFAAIHKVFGASNAAKLLLHVPQPDRCEAVVSIAYEAQARLRDPVYGCVSHIFALQQQVVSLQCQLMQAKAQVARGMAGSGSGSGSNSNSRNGHHDPLLQSNNYMYDQSIFQQSWVDCGDHNWHGAPSSMPPEVFFGGDDFSAAAQIWNKRCAPHEDQIGELQALASKMMRD